MGFLVFVVISRFRVAPYLTSHPSTVSLLIASQHTLLVLVVSNATIYSTSVRLCYCYFILFCAIFSRGTNLNGQARCSLFWMAEIDDALTLVRCKPFRPKQVPTRDRTCPHKAATLILGAEMDEEGRVCIERTLVIF